MKSPPQRKETVIIVHGTWANSPDPVRRWYDRGSVGSIANFTTRLDSALASRGSAARCWAHVGKTQVVFDWSGANHWLDRSLAAARLATLIQDLQSNGWICHIVAHSHGGNVALEAISLLATSREPVALNGTFVAAGTPFIYDNPFVLLLLLRGKIRAGR